MKRFLTFFLFSAVLFGGGMSVHVLPVVAQTASSTVSSPTAGDAASVSKPIPYDSTQSTDSYNQVMIWIMSIFAWLLGIAALVLDYTMYYTVVVMGNYINHLSSIGVVWKTLRDVSNIVLIFGFMAMGISVMLDTERLGYGKKMLPTLLVVAVFINFSLFVSEAVIDVGNLFATELYTQINGGTLPTVSASGYLVDAGGQTLGTGKEGISNKIMSQLGLTTIYGTITTNPDTAKDLFKGSNPTFMAFMAVLLFITTAFVMFSLSFILIARFVTLILLIIVAPVGFAGLAVPKLGGYAKKWWNLLFKKAFEAPVLLLVLYVALKVITDANFLTGFGFSSAGTGANSAYAGFTQTSGAGLSSLAGVILSFLVAMGLLIAVTLVAKGMSASGAGFATKWGARFSFGATAAAGGFFGRRTAGRISNYSASKIRSSSFGRTDLGRVVAGVADRGAKATYDFRGSKTVAQGLKSAGIEAGPASKISYQNIEKTGIENRTKYAKTLELTANEQAEKKSLEKEIETATNLRDERLAQAGNYQPAHDEAHRLYKERVKILNEGEFDQAGIQTKKGLDDFKGLPQKQYAGNLQKAGSLKKFGTFINAAGAGGVLGLTHGLPVAAFAGLGAGVAVTGTVGVTGAGAYIASATPRVNKVAADKILKEAKLTEADKNIAAIRKAIQDADKAEATENKEKKEES